MKEESKLVAGEFRVLGLLFGRLEPRPVKDEAELCQVGVFAQGGKQTRPVRILPQADERLG